MPILEIDDRLGGVGNGAEQAVEFGDDVHRLTPAGDCQQLDPSASAGLRLSTEEAARLEKQYDRFA